MIRTLCLLAAAALVAAGDAAPLDAAALAARSPLVAALAPSAGEWKPAGPATAPDRKTDLDRLVKASAKLAAALKAAKDGPDAVAQGAIGQLLKVLPQGARAERPDALDPDFCRRAVRGGALRGLGVDAAASEVEKAVIETERLLPVAAFTGPGGARLEDRRDAFGEGGWTLTGPRIAYAVEHPRPQFLPMPELSLVVELPAGADPLAGPDKAVAARLVPAQGGTAAAEWKAGGKLAAPAWREAVPEIRGRGLAPGLFPPHLVLCGLNGDVAKLITGQGELIPARNGTAAEGERFVADAARVLTDAPHLDLVGQYLFRYVFDSPDSRFPLLMGCTEFKGEVHQTAAQILGVSAGGVCRGDCDDLAELCQTIADKAGRLGHLLCLPSHTAFAAARRDGDDWVLEVMQTGPTLAFRAKDIPSALRAAHQHFDPTAPFSPDNLGLLLRFSGENTRGQFGLGWRIYADAAYARTMIDVQRDWQYQTYARAIDKMRKLIAAGDKDPANLHELAALYRATGQWDEAVAGFRSTMAETTDQVSIYRQRMDIAGALRRAGKADEARAELAKGMDDLRTLAPKLGNGVPQAGISLSLALLGAGDREKARQVFTGTALGPLTQVVGRLGQAVGQPGFDPRSWRGDGNLAALRRLVMMFNSAQLSLLEKGGDPVKDAKDPLLKRMHENLEIWLARLAFLEADTPADAIAFYAMAARIHALDIGADAVAAAAATAAIPAKGDVDHLRRKDRATEQRAQDLGWIRICPQYWAQEQLRLLRGGEHDSDDGDASPDALAETIDREAVVACGRRAAEARDACRKLGLESEGIEESAHRAQMLAAVVGGDDKALRERLRFVARKGDKRLRDSCAALLGMAARHCDDKRWDLVLKAWKDELNYKPKWFLIAWVAATGKAPKQALATARAAVAAFKDEPAFREELAFMEKLLAPAKTGR